jgi:hypothetical protein
MRLNLPLLVIIFINQRLTLLFLHSLLFQAPSRGKSQVISGKHGDGYPASLAKIKSNTKLFFKKEKSWEDHD